ncbi:hypothetical protein F5Y07DRAFT_397474 [Xylaria sp. FL0933]|nr:hypothetical protein F5Y07DRAFT_397474 [Xylaria sp. FL0933]
MPNKKAARWVPLRLSPPRPPTRQPPFRSNHHPAPSNTLPPENPISPNDPSTQPRVRTSTTRQQPEPPGEASKPLSLSEGAQLVESRANLESSLPGQASRYPSFVPQPTWPDSQSSNPPATSISPYQTQRGGRGGREERRGRGERRGFLDSQPSLPREAQATTSLSDNPQLGEPKTDSEPSPYKRADSDVVPGPPFSEEVSEHHHPVPRHPIPAPEPAPAKPKRSLPNPKPLPPLRPPPLQPLRYKIQALGENRDESHSFRPPVSPPQPNSRPDCISFVVELGMRHAKEGPSLRTDADAWKKKLVPIQSGLRRIGISDFAIVWKEVNKFSSWCITDNLDNDEWFDIVSPRLFYSERYRWTAMLYEVLCVVEDQNCVASPL